VGAVWEHTFLLPPSHFGTVLETFPPITLRFRCHVTVLAILVETRNLDRFSKFDMFALLDQNARRNSRQISWFIMMYGLLLLLVCRPMAMHLWVENQACS